MVSRRHAKANNKQCPGYDPEKLKTWIQYIDANNLYGWAMIQRLPICGFSWISLTLEEVLATSDDAPEGFVVEPDIEYPENLHYAYDDYYIAPETISI